MLSGLGFLLAYLYVAEFFRQYAAAMALAGLLSVAVFQALGLYTIPACANLHSRLTRLLTGWTVTVGAAAGDRILPEARARVLAGVAGALVRRRRRRSPDLPRRRRGRDQARASPTGT